MDATLPKYVFRLRHPKTNNFVLFVSTPTPKHNYSTDFLLSVSRLQPTNLVWYLQNTDKIQIKFPNPISKYFVANYSWSDAIISTKQHVYRRHRKADLSLVKLTRAHDLLSRAHEFVSRAHGLVSRGHDMKYFTYMYL